MRWVLVASALEPVGYAAPVVVSLREPMQGRTRDEDWAVSRPVCMRRSMLVVDV
jgi:hypothetical protein